MPKIALRMRLAPTEVQEHVLNRYIGAARAVHNLMLEYLEVQYQVYKDSGKDPVFKPKMSAFDLGTRLKQMRDECPWLSWLKDMSMCSLRHSCISVSESYSRFFKQVSRYPRFKRRLDYGCFHIDCENWTRLSLKKHSESGKFSYLRLEQFPRLLDRHLLEKHTDQEGVINADFYESEYQKNLLLKVRFDDRVPLVDGVRKFPGRVSKVTFRHDCSGKWYVSFLCEIECKRSNPGKLTVVGLDLGIKIQAVASDGTNLNNERVFNGLHEKMAKWQRRMARRKPPRGQKPSNRYLYARRQYARACERIRFKREHLIHQYTTSLVRTHRMIVIEDLAVSNMVKNHSLAKALTDVSLRRIREQLVYKVQLDGISTLMIADRWYPSSHLCHACGQHVGRKLKLSIRGWTCPHCGAGHDRDFNASKNLEQLGIKHYPEAYKLPGGVVLLPRFTV
jgi:putative transposase